MLAFCCFIISVFNLLFEPCELQILLRLLTHFFGRLDGKLGLFACFKYYKNLGEARRNIVLQSCLIIYNATTN